MPNETHQAEVMTARRETVAGAVSIIRAKRDELRKAWERDPLSRAMEQMETCDELIAAVERMTLLWVSPEECPPTPQDCNLPRVPNA